MELPGQRSEFPRRLARGRGRQAVGGRRVERSPEVPGVVLATERVGGDDAIEFLKDRLKARGLGKETSPGAMATQNTDSGRWGRAGAAPEAWSGAPGGLTQVFTASGSNQQPSTDNTPL